MVDLGAGVKVAENLLLNKNIGSLIVKPKVELNHYALTQIGTVTTNEFLCINNLDFKSQISNLHTQALLDSFFPTVEEKNCYQY